jgi:undecaprenyl diphosphate synthase
MSSLIEQNGGQFCTCSLEERTADNPGLTCAVALSYGGKQDIVQAAQHAARLVAAGKLQPEDLSEDVFQSLLLTKEIRGISGPPDLLIRCDASNVS